MYGGFIFLRLAHDDFNGDIDNSALFVILYGNIRWVFGYPLQTKGSGL